MRTRTQRARSSEREEDDDDEEERAHGEKARRALRCSINTAPGAHHPKTSQPATPRAALSQSSDACSASAAATQAAAMLMDNARLVCLAKWPGSGHSKTRLSSQLVASAAAAAAAAGLEPPTATLHAAARRAATDFVAASLSDLLVRFAPAAADSVNVVNVLVYSPPTEAARAWFEALARSLGVADAWRLLPVLEASDPSAADLGAVLGDATRRGRLEGPHDVAATVLLFGADSPELPLRALAAAAAAASAPAPPPAASTASAPASSAAATSSSASAAAAGRHRAVASICPAADGGYALLALPPAAEPSAVFSSVRWSARDTCLSQLAALSAAGIVCHVGETFADVDELSDLLALIGRLDDPRAAEACPHTRRMLDELRAADAFRAVLPPPN